MEATLRRHDRVALAERRRRNVMPNLSFGYGCRCCYDTTDGGEYMALTDLRAKMEQEKKENGNGDNEDDIDGGNHNVEEKERDDDSDDDDSDDDSEFDYLLDEDLPGGDMVNNELKLLQQERMEELQLSAMIRESAMQHGFGVHRQFDPQRILHAAGLGLEGGGSGKTNQSRQRSGPVVIPPASVIHLYQNSTLSASLDLCLEEMAESSYKGTKFLRSDGRTTLAFNHDLVQKVLPSLKVDSSLPALVAVKDGVVVSICENLSLFVTGSSAHYGNTKDDEMVEARAVEEWLDRAGVLLHDVPIAYEDYCRIRPEEDALLENMMREKAKLDNITPKEEIYNCGVPGCQKVFHHEHIGVKNDKQSGLLLYHEITEDPSGLLLCQETTEDPSETVE